MTNDELPKPKAWVVSAEYFERICADRLELDKALRKLVLAVEFSEIRRIHNLSTLGRAMNNARRVITKVEEERGC